MNDKLIGYARLVAIAAVQNQLGEETAIAFCRDAVPQLLAEIEVLSRVNQKFEVALGLVVPEPAPQAQCEATICSNRWKAPEEPKATKKPRKPRKKKARAK